VKSICRVAALASAFVLVAPDGAEAFQSELFAPSLASLGRAAAGSALEDGAASIFWNPAALGLVPHDRLAVSYLGGRIHLLDVEGVTRIALTGDADEDRMPEQAIQPHRVGVEFVKSFGDWVRLGAFVTVPFPYLYFIDTRDPWTPVSLRWRNRVAQVYGGAGLSVRLPLRGIPGKNGVTEASATQGGLWLAFSIDVRPRATIKVDLGLVGLAGEDGGDLGVDVVIEDLDLVAIARFRPTVGLLFDFGAIKEELEGVRFGFSYKKENSVHLDPVKLSVEVSELGELQPLFSAVNRLQAVVWLGIVDYFDPHQFRFSFAIDRPRFAFAVDATVSKWSRLVPPATTVIQGEDGERGFLSVEMDFQDTFAPVAQRRTVDTSVFRDTVDVSVGGEVRPPGLTPAGAKGPVELRVRAGYRFQPPVVEPSAGPYALLDGPVHTMALGTSIRLPNLGKLPGAFVVDWAISYLRLAPMDLPKTETGLAGVEGLPVAYSEGARWPGGWALVSGLSISVDL
jgi:hypothetical protein